MDHLTSQISENFVFFLMASCFVMAIILRSITSIATTVCREKSRREIAAYIAEGSMSGEQGERLIRADVNRGADVP